MRPHRQSRLRRSHQGQPLDADRLRGPGLQRARLQAAAPAVASARPSPGCAAPNRPGMPPYVAVPHLRGGTDNFFHYAAYLGGGANPFIVESDPNTPDFRVKNLSLPPDMTFDRLEDRRHVLDAVDQVRRAGDRRTGRPGRALPARLRPADQPAGGRPPSTSARSRPRVRDRYGRHTFGQSALLARRLVEAGVTFVTVNCVPWDHHGTAAAAEDGGGRAAADPAARPGHRGAGRGPDAARPVREDAGGGDGRVRPHAADERRRRPRPLGPHVQRADGLRPHAHGPGRSAAAVPRGEYVVDRPITPQDVAATVYHHLGIDANDIAFTDGLSRPISLLEGGQPIRELFA